MRGIKIDDGKVGPSNPTMVVAADILLRELESEGSMIAHSGDEAAGPGVARFRADSRGKLKINVVLSTGEQSSLFAEIIGTVGDLKMKIPEEKGIPVDSYDMHDSGSFFENDRSL